MSKNTQISELINYISVDGSGNVVLSSGQLVATQSYVTTAITNLVNSAPSTLDTLNELASALGNDANFATTVATSIGTKQAQLNGTGFVKISGTTISYDNSTYLTTATASSTYLTTTTAGTTYVPYTGGTANVNLGVYDLDGGNININGGGSGGGALRLKQYGSSEANREGYNSISTLTSGVFYFTSSASVPNFKNFVLNPSGLTDNTTRTYALPDASGTLALTSNLSSYLLLAGGTLTGSLVVPSPFTIKDTNPYIQWQNSSGTRLGYIQHATNLVMSADSGNIILTTASGSFTLASAGAATFNSSVTATYGYFSGTGFTSFNSQLTVNNTTSSPALITFQNTLNGHAFGFNSSGTQRFTFINGGLNEILSVTSAGVVTAEQQFRTKIGYQFYADGTAQGGIYPYKIWSGAGTDTTPTFAAEGNLGIYFCVNGQTSKVLTLASTGHLLVGATSTDQTFWPSWDGGVIRIGQGGTIFHYRDSVVDFMIGGNYYISSSGAQETRIGTGGASNIYMENGNIRFRNAVSGAAGSSISWNTSLFLQTNGFVGASTQTQWNNERFGVGMSQTNTWANVTAIMRLTNYISGGVTKITFTDSSIIDGWFGMVPVANASYFVMGFSGQTEQGFRLYQNGTSYFASTMTVNGSILPNSDASYNLGSTSFRWNNVYTTDLHLSNEGKQNIVDGTWGDWTLQEGENDIFMLNNRSGEKFKIKLEKI